MSVIEPEPVIESEPVTVTDEDKENREPNLQPGGARKKRSSRVAKKPTSRPRSKSPMRKRKGGSDGEPTTGGAKKRVVKKAVKAAKPVRKPRSKSPVRRGGFEEMDGGAKRVKTCKKPSKYNLFVKKRMCDMKKTNPSMNVVEKMKKIASEWKANK